jgi:hypothetical protein
MGKNVFIVTIKLFDACLRLITPLLWWIMLFLSAGYWLGLAPAGYMHVEGGLWLPAYYNNGEL